MDVVYVHSSECEFFARGSRNVSGGTHGVLI